MKNTNPNKTSVEKDLDGESNDLVYYPLREGLRIIIVDKQGE